MIKPQLLIAALVGILFFSKASAQTDTSYYDLGRLQLRKDFTQRVTVKGADLEKMPFNDLAEAINVWFYGTYTKAINMVYIIDGNLVNDVNVYSIYDIDEVTLIQNAVTTMSGASGPEQLIVIKTKRSKEKGFGITTNGQAGISSLYTNNIFNSSTNSYENKLKSTSTVYQQYYISAHETTDKINFDISADYLRDVLPVIKQQGTVYNTPLTLDRLKFNTYLDVKMGNSALAVTASYDPQQIKYTLNEVMQEALINGNMKNHIFNGTLNLTTHFAQGFTNVIHGDYNYYRDNENNSSEVQAYPNGNNQAVFNGNEYDYNIVAYDNFSYNVKFGHWNFEPAVNLNFRTFRDSSYNSELSYSSGAVEVSSNNYYEDNTHLFLLTPSLSFYYKTYFNVQAGFLDDLSTSGVYNFDASKPQKVLPFITSSADVLHLINPNSSISLKIYGSFSTNDLFTDNSNTLSNLTNLDTQIPVIGSTPVIQSYYGTAIYSPSASYQYQTKSTTYKTFSAGLSFSPQNSAFSANYFFEKTSCLSPIYIYEPYGVNEEQEISTYTTTNFILNRIGVTYRIVKNHFNWQTAINATMIKQSYPDVDYTNTKVTVGNGEWTGGWVNRLSYRDFFAGADILYQVGENVYSVIGSGIQMTDKINSFSLQNLYVGYHLKIKGLKTPEIYANARNILQNKKEDITNDRKYYGIGFKLSL